MSIPTLITFVAYVLAMLGIGYWAYKATSTMQDYLLGGRKLGAPVAALSAGASDMSGWLLLGVPGALYLSGLAESWIIIGLIIGAYLNWRFVAQPLREQTEELDAVTLPDFLARKLRDDSGIIRIVSALVIVIFFTFYASSGLVAGAKLFAATFEMSYLAALFTGIAVILVYTAVGGFLAVSWTDFMQGVLMLIALIAVPLAMISELGGVGDALTDLGERPGGMLSLTHDMTALGIASLMAWGLGYFGQPHILVRFMAIDGSDNVGKARRIAMGWMIFSTLGAIAVGLLGIVFLEHRGLPALEGPDSEKIFIEATQLVFNPWVAGIFLAAILAAIMSTIDSQLLVSSSALSQDVYLRSINPHANDKTLVNLGRITVLVISVVALLLALDPESEVLGLVSYAWAGLGASFGPVVLLVLYWPGTHRWGALAGMLVGAVTVVVWKELSGGLFDVYELLPAFIAALLATWLVSLAANRE